MVELIIVKFFAIIWFALVLLVTHGQHHRKREDDVCATIGDGADTFTCARVDQCPKLRKLLANGNVVSCGFDGVVQKICCPQEADKEKNQNRITKNPADNAKENSTSTPDAAAIAWRKCQDYAEARYVRKIKNKKYENELDCFIPPDFEIFVSGGKPANPKEFPHMALVGYNPRLEDVSWDCGGTLISERYVLSAAHCNEGGLGLARWIRLGELVLDTITDGEHHADYPIISRIVHPEYKPPLVYNDIALFKLGSEVKFNPYIRPICLYAPNVSPEISSGSAVITGWGYTGAGEQRSETLLQAKVFFIESDDCKSEYDADPKFKTAGFDDDTMLCAGNQDTDEDTCGGDSGGPLQRSVAGQQCMDVQIGITSVGSTFCGSRKPAVYTKVSRYLPWIQQNVWPQEDETSASKIRRF